MTIIRDRPFPFARRRDTLPAVAERSPHATRQREADLWLRGPNGPVWTRVCWPAAAGRGERTGVVVIVPEVGESNDGADALSRELCCEVGLVVLTIREPVNELPAAFDAATTALEWAADHAMDLGADPTRLLAGGVGSGQALAGAAVEHLQQAGIEVELLHTFDNAIGESMSNGRKQFTITREIAASAEQVYRAWTDPDRVADWWHPAPGWGAPREKIAMDVRPGGRWELTMVDPDGNEYPAVFVYREVVAPERLTFTTGAADADPDDPATPVGTVTIEELDGAAKLTFVDSAPAGQESDEAQGWGAMLDALAQQTGGAR